MPDTRTGRRYRFGVFEADAATGELRRQGMIGTREAVQQIGDLPVHRPIGLRINHPSHKDPPAQQLV